MIYLLERYLIQESPDGGFDGAFIYQDNSENWYGQVSYAWVIGDKRYEFGDGHAWESGGRFRNVYLPADTEVITANLVTVAAANIDTMVNSKFSIQDSISAPSFPETGTYADFVGRARLETMVEWNGITGWTGDEKILSPNLASLIQGLIDEHGAIDHGEIVIFWGDREGNTPVPPEDKSNHIVTHGYAPNKSIKLQIMFYSAVDLIGDPGIFHKFDSIVDARYEINEELIRNDVRVIVPHYSEELDYSYSPPILRPVDLSTVRIDEHSQKLYGRRTVINKSPIGLWDFYAPSWCSGMLRDSKDPIPIMTLRVIPQTDDDMARVLAAKITDKAIIEIDEAGLDGKFFIDGKVLTLLPDGIRADFNLREINPATVPENVKHVFIIGVDKIGDPEAVIG